MSILVIDDYPSARLETEAWLKAGEHTEVLKAKSAIAAFQILGIDGKAPIQPPVDLILMDVEMPEMSGIEACRKIKATPKIKDIPVIMMTLYD